MKTNPHSIEALEARIAPAFGASINLATLGVGSAVVIPGEGASDNFGVAVGAAGDVNGDHIDDLIVGAFTAGASGAGASYVVFGKSTGFDLTFSLSSLNGSNGFKLQGEAALDVSGSAVSAAGDLNGDGFGDLIVAARQADPHGANSGATYVVFGHAGGFTNPLNLGSLFGANGFKIQGEAAEDRAGSSVSAAGDVNGDGFDDLIIGAPGTGAFSGSAYVLFGKSTAFATPLDLSSLTGPNGFKIFGAGVAVSLGVSVSGAGDVNGDGFADLLMGAPQLAPNGTASGGSFVVFGKPGFTTPLNLSNLIGTDGFQIYGAAAQDYAGFAVSAAGDINGDGFDDVLIGARSADGGGANSGVSYVIFGHAGGFATPLELSALDGTNGFKIRGEKANDASGAAVSAAGDVNADGFDDLLIGANSAGPNSSGAAYVIFGKAASFGSSLNLSGLTGANGFKIFATGGLLNSGLVVSAAGDLNADGFADVLLGAAQVDASYVVFGSNGSNAVTIGPAGKTAAFTDVNGDLVTIKTSKGPLTADEFTLTGANAFGGATLRKIDFQGHTELGGTSLSITAKPQVIGGMLRGDGLVNVGDFDATGLALGAVSVAGDLGQFHFGAGSAVPAAKSFTVNSLGLAGLATQGGVSASLTSTIAGALPKFTVKTGVTGIVLGATQLGAVKIGASLIGSQFFLSGTSTAVTVLKNLTIGGNLENSRILGGYSAFGGNADAQIGKVSVGGDWLASSLVAGITAGADGFLGTADDKVFTGGNAALLSRIASVAIKGQALGTFAPGGHFAITAEQVGAVTIGKSKVPLSKPAKDHFFALGPTSDFVLNEV